MKNVIPYGSTRNGTEPPTLFHLCENDVLPNANNPYNIQSIRKLWIHSRKIQKAKQNLSLAKGFNDPYSHLSGIPEEKLFEIIGSQREPTLNYKKASQALRRETIGKLSGRKELFDAEKRLATAKMLYPGESDESYLGDDDINVSNRIRDIYLEKGDIPFSEKRVNQYLNTKKKNDKNTEKIMDKMSELKMPEKVDMELPLPNFEKNMKVSWNSKSGKEKYGVIKEVKDNYAIVINEDGLAFPKKLERLKPIVDEDYLDEMDGGSTKRKEKKKTKKKKKKSK